MRGGALPLGGVPAYVNAERARDISGYVYIVSGFFESVRTTAATGLLFGGAVTYKVTELSR
jgi:hypothetical protein